MNATNMTQETINQRLNFLIENLGLSIRAFSATLGVSDTNTRNYLAKGTKPNSDYLESILRHFSRVNPTWLLLGEGEPFKDDGAAPPTQTSVSGKKNAVNIAGGKATQNNYSIADCEKERDGYKAERDVARAEVASLRQQLELAQALVAAKEEMLVLLRGGHNRPN
ncbi:helix-turn-helix domain-containing protein [Hymenobacter defluvii]|uniref:Helix-turn-helix transcriptional regulator n=1 Tax=Hymenobacter defluvii TaxID=2054411 RepID=A0ABS3TAV5_9BACT|nr:helix-turn-helix transcriptional regulator [Hymenobacter defluvii]MBO3270785.1 helix-turn-helix transcriptional regulator [Hymenobacter defluvii]